MTVHITSYRPIFRPDFERLNRAWLSEMGIEARDEEAFADPEWVYVVGGGAIYVALKDEIVVGTVALRCMQPGVCELCKLAVDPASRRKGIGDQLILTVIAGARARGASQLILTTHTRLEAAVRLYRRHGFAPVSTRLFPERTRANLEMCLDV